VTALVPLALAVAVIVLTVQIGRRGTVAAAGTGGVATAPTAPTEEFVQVEDLFPLQQAAAPPAQYPADTPTQVLPPAQAPQVPPAAPTQVLPPAQPTPPPAQPVPPAQPNPPANDWSLLGPTGETPETPPDPLGDSRA
jgi:hypothetical protein